MKTFCVDLDKCTGCYGCQFGCKDEHCGQAWPGYTEAQPESGQFWMHVKQFERGQRPHVKVCYIPTMCQQCDDCPPLKIAKNGAMYRRDDGLIMIDPEKAKGQEELVKACPYGAIYWNAELNLPQKCTQCAHLQDGKDPMIKVPRCFDNCPTGALQWGEESELDLQGAEHMHTEYGTNPRVWYKGLPKRFVAGTVYDPEKMEIVEGADVSIKSDSMIERVTRTDDWGDFLFDDLPKADFTITIKKGDKKKVLEVSTVEEDKGLPDIALD